jgi:hypothetical protein
MLPQLVGMQCAVCTKRVGSEIDGRFCEVCGNPVHNRCATHPAGPALNDDILSVAAEAICSRCGACPHTQMAQMMRQLFIRQRIRVEVAPIQRTAESDYWWMRLTAVGLVSGLGLLVLCIVASTAAANPDDRTLARVGIVFGLAFLAGGLVSAWLRRAAWQRAQAEQDRAAREKEGGPPE